MPYRFTCNNLSKNELKQVAELHVKYLETGFLSQLGAGFLFYLYQSMYQSQETVLIIAKHNDEVIGFVSGASSLKPIYKTLIKKHLFGVIFSILPKLFSPSKLKKILEILSYSKSNKQEIDNFPENELLSIIVKEKFRRFGVAKQLVDQLCIQFKKKGVSDFKIIVGGKLINSQKFYEKIGAKKIGEVEVHKGESSIVYKMKVNIS